MLIPYSIYPHLFGMLWLREAILRKKKLFTFGHFPKVALPPSPPPVLDTLGVTFAKADLGKSYYQKLPQNNLKIIWNYLKTTPKLLE